MCWDRWCALACAFIHIPIHSVRPFACAKNGLNLCHHRALLTTDGAAHESVPLTSALLDSRGGAEHPLTAGLFIGLVVSTHTFVATVFYNGPTRSQRTSVPDSCMKQLAIVFAASSCFLLLPVAATACCCLPDCCQLPLPA